MPVRPGLPAFFDSSESREVVLDRFPDHPRVEASLRGTILADLAKMRYDLCRAKAEAFCLVDHSFY